MSNIYAGHGVSKMGTGNEMQDLESAINLGIKCTWIQNVADLWRNGRFGKVFELVDLRFRSDIEHDFRIRAIFS